MADCTAGDIVRAFLLLLFAASMFAQTPKVGTVEGKVTNSVTGQPVKHALVTVSDAAGRAEYAGITDSSGTFRIENVKPDRYTATASADGYTTRWTTARSYKAFTVAEDQNGEGIAIEIPPLAAIAGRVTDDTGQPLEGMMVAALSKSGERLNTDASATTDDRGRYRIFDMEPDRYYLMVTDGEAQGEAGQEQRYGATFFPGVPDWKASTAQRVRPGDEISADFRLREKPSYHVRGRVTGDIRRAPVTVSARPCDVFIAGVPAPRATARPDGAFDIGGVFSGEHCLWAEEANDTVGGPAVAVKDDDVNHVEFPMAALFRMQGSATVEPRLAEAPSIVLWLIEARGTNHIHGNSGKDGIVDVPDVPPGSYRLFGFYPPGLYVKTIWYGTQDVSDGIIPMAQEGVPLRIALGSDPAQVEARVASRDAESGAPLRWLLMPQGALAGRWYLRQSTGAAGNSFRFDTLAPGDYKIFAIESADDDNIFDAELLGLLDARGTAVTLHAGERQSVTVAPISVGEVERAKSKLK